MSLITIPVCDKCKEEVRSRDQHVRLEKLGFDFVQGKLAIQGNIDLCCPCWWKMRDEWIALGMIPPRTIQ